MASALTNGTPPVVGNDEILWRVLRPEWIVDGRVSSIAFKDRTAGNAHRLSVFRGALIELGEIRGQVPADFPAVGVAELVAGVPRGLGWEVIPDIEGQHMSHALIVPPESKGRNARDRDAKTMASVAILRGL